MRTYNEYFQNQNESPKVTKKYVIIDTDCGVDDAVAIMLAAYGHKKGLIKILAITCVAGNTTVDNVVRNVTLTLKLADLKVKNSFVN